MAGKFQCTGRAALGWNPSDAVREFNPDRASGSRVAILIYSEFRLTERVWAILMQDDEYIGLSGDKSF
jgi:hypothetical protein